MKKEALQSSASMADSPSIFNKVPSPMLRNLQGNESSTRHLSVTCLRAFKQKSCSDVGQTLAWGVCVPRLRILGNPVFLGGSAKRLY